MLGLDDDEHAHLIALSKPVSMLIAETINVVAAIRAPAVDQLATTAGY